jgi:uncharacterized protein (TIGR03066 family)
MRWSRFAAAGFLVLALTLAGTAGTDNAKKILGRWEATKSYEKGPPVGMLVTFLKDGKVKLQAKIMDKDLKAEGTYKVKGKKLITKIEFGGESKEETATIKNLTANELAIEDDKGQVVEFKRVTKKKKKGD